MSDLPVPVSTATYLLCIVFLLLVPFAAIGLSLISTGLGRSRSAAHSMLSSLCVIAVAALVYLIVGCGVQGLPGGPARFVAVRGIGWNWIGAGPWLLRGLPPGSSPASLIPLLQIMSVGIAALIPLGSGSDRWRLGAICLSTALFSAVTYPLFAHWVWGGGWLASLGEHYGLGYGFVDTGGSSTIHVVGGLTALSITWILRARRGRYTAQGVPAAIPGHNAVYVLLGSLLALAGWIGLNGAGAMLFAGIDPAHLAPVVLNTLLAASSAILASLAVTKIRFRKPDASLAANGWIGGLVAISASCAFVKPAHALIIGFVAGAIVPLSVELFEVVLETDDPAGAVSTHAISGIWGILAAGLMGNSSFLRPGAPSGQFIAQVVGLSTLLGVMLPLTYGLNLLIDRFYPQRVSSDGEHYGLDLFELGAGAYPEFVTHTEDFQLQ